MPGRKPKPTELHRLHGTYQPVRHDRRANEPRPQGDLGEPPEKLGATAAALWRHYLAVAPAGVLKSVDAGVFENFIVATDIAQRAAAILACEGLMVETPRGTAEHPASRVLARYAVIAMKAGAECGFSPAARPRIQLDGAAEEKNPFEAFGGGRPAEQPTADDDAVH